MVNAEKVEREPFEFKIVFKRLRDGVWVKCLSKKGSRGPQLVELLEINGKGTTVLLATHEHSYVRALGGRSLVLDRGRLVKDEVDPVYGKGPAGLVCKYSGLIRHRLPSQLHERPNGGPAFRLQLPFDP